MSVAEVTLFTGGVSAAETTLFVEATSCFAEAASFWRHITSNARLSITWLISVLSMAASSSYV